MNYIICLYSIEHGFRWARFYFYLRTYFGSTEYLHEANETILEFLVPVVESTHNKIFEAYKLKGSLNSI